MRMPPPTAIYGPLRCGMILRGGGEGGGDGESHCMVVGKCLWLSITKYVVVVVVDFFPPERSMPCRLVWFVFVGIGGHLGSSRQQRLGFRHVAPRRMRVMPNSIFFNTSSCKDLCFEGCIFRCVVKSSGVWEVTHPFTSGLPPGVTLNSIFYNTSSCMHQTVCLWLPGVMSGHRCIEVNMAWTVMFIVDVLSHNQIYGEDIILMGVKYTAIPISNRTISSE